MDAKHYGWRITAPVKINGITRILLTLPEVAYYPSYRYSITKIPSPCRF